MGYVTEELFTVQKPNYSEMKESGAESSSRTHKRDALGMLRIHLRFPLDNDVGEKLSSKQGVFDQGRWVRSLPLLVQSVKKFAIGPALRARRPAQAWA
jgi:hypothetical protein